MVISGQSKRWGIMALGWFLGTQGVVSQAGVVTFLNDYEGFLAAAGDVRTIDFETLPDGSPSHVGVPITPDFNYTDQGVTFSAPMGELFISGNPISGFGLMADAYFEQQRTWIIADFEPAASAVGVFFAGWMHLEAYDADNELIAQAYFGHAGGGPWFLGIVADQPILGAIADKQDDVNFMSSIGAFTFASIPEPATGLLVILGLVAMVRMRPAR